MKCFVDESIYSSMGFVAVAFVFTESNFEDAIAEILLNAGLSPKIDEFKSRIRMDADSNMRNVRARLTDLARNKSKIAVVYAPYNRLILGKQCLQALQSVIVRNGLDHSTLSIHFDEQIFPSDKEASRILKLFNYLSGCTIHPIEDSKTCFGIQVADLIAHEFGQIIKEEISGEQKLVDIGGAGTGNEKGHLVNLGWELLMTFRYCLFTRPMICNNVKYDAATDPVIIDPQNEDQVDYGQNPILLGWGVQVAPEANTKLRQSVENVLGKIWLGCIH